MTKRFLGLIAILSLGACSTQNKSGSQAVDPLASHFTPGMESEIPQSRYELKDKCVNDRAKSYSSRLSLNGDSYTFELTEFLGPRCTGLNADFIQTGSLSQRARADGTAQLHFTPQQLSFRYYQKRPNSLQTCGREAQLSNSSLWVGEASECPAIKLPVFLGQPTASEFNLETLFPAEFEILDDRNSARWTYTPNPLSAPEPDHARFLCDNRTDAVLKNGSCTSLSFDKSDEDNHLEFEVGTGHYPRIKPSKRILAKGNDEIQSFKISYRFPCVLKNLANPNASPLKALTIEFQRPEGDPHFIIPTEGPQTFAISGRGDLLVLQDLEAFASDTLKLSRYQVDPKCRLSIELNSN